MRFARPAARPAVISFALGDPGDLVRQAHDIGAKVMIQVTTVAQAIEASKRGADVIIAQGSEAGGYGGNVSTMTLVPQVVDAVSPIPGCRRRRHFRRSRYCGSTHAGGGRCANVGTRFLASLESPIDDAWKAAITAAQSEDAVKMDVLNDIQLLPGTKGDRTVLRSLHISFMDDVNPSAMWRQDREQLWAEMQARARAAGVTRCSDSGAKLRRDQDNPARGRDPAPADHGSRAQLSRASRLA